MRKTESGMTLLEVLLAATILGVGIVSLLGALMQATRTLANVKETVIASSLARSKLEEVLAGEELETGVLEGEFEEPHASYRWRAVIEEREYRGGDEEEEDETEDLMQVRLEVLWDRGDKESVFYLETLHLKEIPELLSPIAPPTSGAGADAARRRDARRGEGLSGQDRTLEPSNASGTSEGQSLPSEQEAIDAFFGQKRR